jgi:sec-independent protein translocase protein TatA
LLVCLLLFGANRLPEIGKSIGEGVREFKKSLKEIQDDEKRP